MRLIILSFLLTFCIPLSAQSGIVNGVVTSQGTPLGQASVVVLGTSTGTLTNSAGQYILSIPIGTVTLRFTYLSCISVDTTISVKPLTLFNTDLTCDWAPTAYRNDATSLSKSNHGFTAPHRTDLFKTIPVLQPFDQKKLAELRKKLEKRD